jgi:tagatose-1,6-bisphosphate aldolase non-catalytic subunit AgaZ/GatZ
MGRIRQIAEERGVPLVDLILQTIRKMGRKATLLAVCPNSEAVTKAAVVAARDADAPMLYAATLNQVDLDGGYTGWTPADMVGMAKTFADEYGFKGNLAVCSDHCGPYCKDVHSIGKWPVAPAMWGVGASCVAAMQAGYDLLHIDPTIDKTLAPGESISIDTVVERTLALIAQVERFRRTGGRPRIGYEVGTEEVHGGLADMSTFRRFLEGLKSGLAALGLEDVWPTFVVGKVGTDLHTTEFDPEVAGELVPVAAEYGSFIKGHYTDNCSNLEAYPEAGMGGANVGPEFTMAEYAALMELLETEDKLSAAGRVKPSDFKAALTGAVVESGRWKKWLQKDEEGKTFDELSADRRDWLTQTGCRYIWTAPGVVEARKALYDNVAKAGVNGNDYVVDAIVKVINVYIDKFNLAGLDGEIVEAIGTSSP